MIPINYLAVVVSAVAAMIIGFLWYGPLFGKSWMRLMNITPESVEVAKKKGMLMQYTIMPISVLVMSYVLAHNVLFGSSYLEMRGVSAGLQAGLWNWLGFVAPVTLGRVLWEGKSWKLWMLDSGYYLVSLIVMGAILASWPAGGSL